MLLLFSRRKREVSSELILNSLPLFCTIASTLLFVFLSLVAILACNNVVAFAMAVAVVAAAAAKQYTDLLWY
jgi:accessory gene regulator protein AgrB